MILVIDHYDSFIDMISDYIATLGYAYQIIKTDSQTLATIDIKNYSHIIIGPGPGHPHDESLAQVYPILQQAILHDIPVLGICLGHQMIANYFGAKIITAARICHGLVQSITQQANSIIFNNLPTIFNVTRYHSLIVATTLANTPLRISATTNHDEVMALEHTTYRIYGVQFHPESIMTEYGHE